MNNLFKDERVTLLVPERLTGPSSTGQPRGREARALFSFSQSVHGPSPSVATLNFNDLSQRFRTHAVDMAKNHSGGRNLL